MQNYKLDKVGLRLYFINKSLERFANYMDRAGNSWL